MADKSHLDHLKLGVAAWNTWRQRNPKIQPDLSEAYLRKEILSGVNLSNAALAKANLSRAILSDANLSGARLSGADLHEAELSRADLHEAELSGVNLSNAALAKANLAKANLSRANLSGATLFEADLREANLFGANLSGANLIGAYLRNAYVFQANLSEVDLPPGTLIGVAFLPIRIYLSQGDPQRIDKTMTAILRLATESGFELADESPVESASWFKSFRAKVKAFFGKPEVQKKLDELEQAVKLQALDKPQAGISKDLADAAASLVREVRDVPNAFLQVGSLVVVKHTGMDGQGNVFVRTLTQDELALLERNPDLRVSPKQILNVLSGTTHPPRAPSSALPPAYQARAKDEPLVLPPHRGVNPQPPGNPKASKAKPSRGRRRRQGGTGSGR